MQGFWLTLGWGLASLLAVSVLVALVEYLRQGAAPPRAVESPLPRALTLDLDLGGPVPADPAGPAADAAPTAAPTAASTSELTPAPPRDPEARQALAEVLERLQRASPEAPWIETTPMVLAARATTTADRQPG
jgi:hypothetical protein